MSEEWPDGWALYMPTPSSCFVATPLERHLLTADKARSLAAWLLKSADHIDTIDERVKQRAKR